MSLDPLETVPGQLDALAHRMTERDAQIRTQFEMGSLRFSALEAGLAENTATTKRLETGLAENTAATKRIEEKTQDLVDLAEAAKGAIKVLNWIGALAKPMGYIVVLIGSVIGAWTAFKSGAGPR